MTNAGIIGIVGANGSGKSLCAVVNYAAPALRKGKAVASNMHIEGARLVRDPTEIPELRDCLFIVDEISSAFPSRSSAAMPAEIVRTLNQLRKVNVVLVWTGPAWERADKVLREVTGRVVVARGMLGRTPRTCMNDTCEDPSCTRRSHQRKDPTGWPPHRLFLWQHYATEMVQEFKLGATSADRGEQRMRAVHRQWYLRPRDGSGPQSLYNTLEPVELFNHLDDFGNCFACGGRRPRPLCSCGGDH